VGRGMNPGGDGIERDEVNLQDGPHAIETEALAGLIADDVGDAWRPALVDVVRGD
jgi:hypothetical protein